MIAIEVIKEAYSLFIKNKILWKFALITTVIYMFLGKLLIFFSILLEFSGRFNWAIFFFVLFFFSVIEVGLVYGVNSLYINEELKLNGIFDALRKSSKHLFIIYIFLVIILSTLFVFLLPFLCFASVLAVTENWFEFAGTNMVWFSLLLFLSFYFISPMISRFFVLRGGTYWGSITRGLKVLFGRPLDTIVFFLFFALLFLIQFVLPFFLTYLILSLLGSEIILSLKWEFAKDVINTPAWTIISLLPMVFSLLWWSATTTIYFKNIQEITTYKPKWIKQ